MESFCFALNAFLLGEDAACELVRENSVSSRTSYKNQGTQGSIVGIWQVIDDGM